MPVFLLPEFILDLQTHADAHFARRVLQKTLLKNGNFREDNDDHRYHGVEGAWIRYVSRGNSAYRVIYIRSGINIYLYRAGEHAVETRLVQPKDAAIDNAIPIAEPEFAASEATSTIKSRVASAASVPPPDRFIRNNPSPDINRAIFGRRKLPHREIWLVSPFINADLLQPTARLGKLIFDQVEDGASVLLVTAPPKDQNTEWLERLEERNLGVYFYPRLHSKLYCFVLDETRKYERGLPDANKLSSLLLVGSANLTKAGLALGENNWNEELCYSIPEAEITYVETYVTDLITRGYDLKTARAFRARGQWQKLEKRKW